MKQFLWEELGLDENFKCCEVDNAYKQIVDKTLQHKLAWKILRDEYYSQVYKEHKDINIVEKAGFIFDKLELDEIEYYNLDLLTTPVSKIKRNESNPVVLLTTGGFDPIHEGHIYMMEFAKKALEKAGYNVVGGYLSPSHESYVSTKPFYTIDAYERLDLCQQIVKDSDWLMIDPWESIYTKTYINFTDVIQRLEKYLRKHVDERIQVAYVFGGDNAEFMYAFENKGIGICVEREHCGNKYTEMKSALNNINNFFIDNKSIVSTYSSRNIRCEKKDYYQNKFYDKENGCYVIRDEGLVPFAKYLKQTDKEMIKNEQAHFLKELISLLENNFENQLDVRVINMQEQLDKADKAIGDKKTISLDTYYKGTYNIETSRLFDISDLQNKYIELIRRMGFESLDEQINKIPAGTYVLIDDDSATGKTIRDITDKLPTNIKIETIYLLASSIKEKIFDIVDLRDFIIGVLNGGLIVKLPNGEEARAPYMLPYVSLKTRASILPSNEMEMSISLWNLNKEFYKKINKDLTLDYADDGFKKLMNYIGFDKESKLVDICDWHINKLLKK